LAHDTYDRPARSDRKMRVARAGSALAAALHSSRSKKDFWAQRRMPCRIATPRLSEKAVMNPAHDTIEDNAN
jgi:hypothetical protein